MVVRLRQNPIPPLYQNCENQYAHLNGVWTMQILQILVFTGGMFAIPSATRVPSFRVHLKQNIMKTLILNLVLLALLVHLSGCYDFELDLDFPSGGYGGNYNDNFDFTIPYEPTFAVDSVIQDSESKLTIWAHIQYDSILIIKNRNLKYYKVAEGISNSITTVIKSEPDTINFRKLPLETFHWSGRKEWIYQYQVPVDNLKKNTDYILCISSDYNELGTLKSIEFCVAFRLQ